MKILKFLLCLFISINIFAAKKWVFFDLGNTLINTDGSTFNYFPNSKNYLSELKNQGYTLGIISNIPESFGKNYDEKLMTLKSYVNEKWDKDSTSFDWSIFDEILLPLSNLELKPNRILFDRALEVASFCPILYISENVAEVQAVSSFGLASYLFENKGSQSYLPKDELEAYILKNYSNDYSENCLY